MRPSPAKTPSKRKTNKGKQRAQEPEASDESEDKAAVDPAWVSQLVKDKAVQGTLIHYYGMQNDPWKIDLAEGFFINFVQGIVNHRQPNSNYIVQKSSKLYNGVSTFPSVFQIYYLILP